MKSHPSWEADNRLNVNVYTELATKHGYDFRALDWGSRASQERRFQILSEVGDLRGRTVLDVGCGLGDFGLWLEARSTQVNYTGIDITPRMIELARTRSPGRRFEVGDLFGFASACQGESFDFVFASGIFAKRDFAPEAYLQEAVACMFRLSSAATVFNVLSDRVKNTEPGEFRANASRTINYCLGLTPRVVVRHDYHPGDFTVYLYKDKPE